MYSENPAYTRNAPILCLLVLAWFVYLSTLSPTVFYRDTPEFVNTAFSLGISHPAGFPIYNLMAKAVTFLPMGAIPFKVNLFSSLMACLALLFLYITSVTFLRVLAGPGDSGSSYLWSSLLPVGFLAFCIPFWGNTMLAEVYTLHALFTVLMILCLLKWKEKEDVRFLYSAALIYGLSAGNHGTVAFYLPAILILFFFWCRKDRWKNLSLCVLFFLWGLSVYLYLPIRSMMEPTFDWGNPETLQGFLFQVTDRKDAHTHFGILEQATASSAVIAETRDSTMAWVTTFFSKAKHIGLVFLTDVYHNLSVVSVVGFLAGAIICIRKNLPLFMFCAVIVGTNISFFVSWRGEAFLPSYIVVSLFTSLLIHGFIFTRWWKPLVATSSDESMGKIIFNKPGLFGIRWGKVAVLLVSLAIPWALIKENYTKVDHSWNYLSETLTRQVYLTLPDKAVFVSGLSWFYYNYNQDVRRLRDDVTTVTVWDLISPHRTGLLTARRYPNLFLPNEEQHDFKSLEGISGYTQEFLEKNSISMPVVMEHNSIMHEQTEFISSWKPYRNILLQFGSPYPDSHFSHQRSWAELTQLLEAELSRPNSGRDLDWLNNPKVWIFSMRDYFHNTKQYELEREALMMIGGFLGQNSSLAWKFQFLDNLIADRRFGKAKVMMDDIKEIAPESYEAWLGEGLLHRAQGQPQLALNAFRHASLLAPRSFRINLEIAKALRDLKKDRPAQAAFQEAQNYISNVRELMIFKGELHQNQ